MVAATVADSDNRKNGEILVQLSGDLNPRLEYTMLESCAYFEPYKHVLRRIQDPKFEEIPFQE